MAEYRTPTALRETATVTPGATLPTPQVRHAVLPTTTHDELARQNFVKSFKLHLATRTSPGNRLTYQHFAKPEFEAKHGRPPKDRHEVRKVMTQDPYYQMWSHMQRSSQEMIWVESSLRKTPSSKNTMPATARKISGSAGIRDETSNVI